MNIVFHSTISKIEGKYFIKDVFYNYLKELCARQQITLITPVSNRRGHFHTKEIDFNGLEVRAIPGNSLKKTLFLNKCLTKSSVTLIFMPTITGALSAFILLFKRSNYILYFGTDWVKIEKDSLVLAKGSLSLLNKLKLKVINIIDKKISNKASLLLVTGGQLKEKYSKLNSNVVETKPIINLTHTIFKRQNKQKKKNMFNVLFVGKIAKAKGVYDLIECIKNIKLNSVRFTIIGDGPDLPELRRYVAKYNLEDKVNILGYINNGPELFDEYLKADTFVLPSYFEGFPRVLYEAMKFGVPIITTSVNSIPFLLKDNETALFIDVSSPKSIEEAIVKLFGDIRLQEKLRTNGLQLVQSILDEPAWKQHLRLINNL